MSLRDQLLKAGLVSKKQVSQVDSQKKKQDHDSKKNQELAQKIQRDKEQDAAAIEEEKRRQQERDKELNRQHLQMLAERESYYRAKQILNSNSKNEQKAPEPYFFAEGNIIRKVMVTPWQREMLARGKMGIGRLSADVDEFIIIPLDSAKTLRDICPSMLLCLFNEISFDEELNNF